MIRRPAIAQGRNVKRLLAATAALLLLSLSAASAAAGDINTKAGGGTGLGDGIPATSAQLIDPRGVALDSAGGLLIAETGSYALRRVDSSGTITTLARPVGSIMDVAVAPDSTIYFATERSIGAIDPGSTSWRIAWQSSFAHPEHLAVDSAGRVYFDFRASDGFDQVHRYDPSSGETTVVAGSENCGGMPAYNGDEIPATSASVCAPAGLAVGADGSLYIADTLNHRIRRVDSSGVIHTVAGNGGSTPAGDGGTAVAASLGTIGALALDGAGHLYLEDTNRVRVLHQGYIDTIAGTGAFGFSGDGGSATAATFNEIDGLATTSDGSQLFIADTGNGRIRVVEAPASLIPVRDTTSPTSTFTTRDGAITGTVSGTSTDAQSGVKTVTVEFTPLLGAPTTVAATTSCTPNRKSCTWSAKAPSMRGSYLVRASASDRAGNVESPGPVIDITVV